MTLKQENTFLNIFTDKFATTEIDFVLLVWVLKWPNFESILCKL